MPYGGGSYGGGSYAGGAGTPATPTVARRVEVQVCLNSARTAVVGTINNASGVYWSEELFDPGGGGFSIHEFDSQFIANPSWFAVGNIYRIVLDSETIFAFIGEEDSITRGEAGDRVWEIKGRGVLALLEESLVYPEYGLVGNPPDQRRFSFASRDYDDSAWSTAYDNGTQDNPSPNVNNPFAGGEVFWVGNPVNWPDPDAHWIWSESVPGQVPDAIPTFVAATTNSSGTPGTTGAVTIPITAQEGDTGILFISAETDISTVSAPPVDPGEGIWQYIFQLHFDAVRPDLWVFVKTISGGEVNTTQNFTWVTPQPWRTDLVVYRGAQSISPVDSAQINFNSSANVNVATAPVNTIQENCKVISFYQTDSTAGYATPPPGQTVRVNASSGGVSVIIADEDAATSHLNYGNHTAVANASDLWNAFTIAIHPQGPVTFPPGGSLAPPGVAYFRSSVTVPFSKMVRVFASADDEFELFVDGVQLTTVKGYWQWKQTFDAPLNLWAGTHVVAIRGRNLTLPWDPTGAGVLFSMIETDSQGEPLTDASSVLLRSTTAWKSYGYPNEPPGFTPGKIVRILINEAKARTELTDIILDFTDSLDTASVAWDPDNIDYSFSVGTSLLQTALQLHDMNANFSMTYNLHLKGWKSRGSDLSSTIVFTPAVNVRNQRIERRKIVKNKFLVRSEESYSEAINDASRTAYGSKSGFLSLGNAPTDQSIDVVTNRAFAQWAQPFSRISLAILGETGKTPWLNFNVGDVVSAPNDTGAATDLRVVTMSAKMVESGAIDFQIELMPPAVTEVT